MRNKSLGYIDFIKAMAVIAVLINHIMGGEAFNWHSIFSVGLFIIISGITCGLSLEKSKEHFRQKKIIRVFIPYVVASGIYVILTNKCLDVKELFFRIINFDATDPVYFVLFYMELILIAPIVYRIFMKMQHPLQICLILILALGLSYIFLRFTNVTIMDDRPFLGAKYLFGGTYFFEFCIGMLVWIHREKLQSYLGCGIMVAGALAIIIFGEIVNWSLKWWSNPPNRYAILFTIAVFFMLYGWWIATQKKFGKNKVWNGINLVIQTVGKYSLMIFLYHIMVRDYFVIPYVYPLILNWHPYLKWTIAILLCILIPMAGSYGFNEIRKRWKHYLEE